MTVNLRKSCLWAGAVMLAISAAMPAFANYGTGLRSYELGDYEGALKEIKPLARQGDAGAQFLLGVMYAEGRGVPLDEVKALAWLACASTGSSKFFRKKSDEWRARLIKTVDAEVLSKATAATGECRASKRREREGIALGKGAEFYRASLLARVFFFAGDSLVLGILAISRQAEWKHVGKFISTLLESSGNLLLGLISVIWWYLAYRVASILARLVLRILTLVDSLGNPTGRFHR